MTRIVALPVALCLLVSLPALPASADLIGGVEFPDGAVSFADAVVGFSPVVRNGQPTTPHLVAENAVGVPDYDGIYLCDDNCTFVTLGDGGSITLQFLDNVLTGSADGEYDLWIFEVGGDVEDTWVAISDDGSTWHAVGKVFGSTSGIDIDAYGFGPDDRFSFVRLTDDGNEGGQTGATVGADIDAVGAIASQPDCTILSVSPPFPWNVGDTITISGAGFLEGSVPLIGGVEAAPFARISDTEIQATVPMLADGEYDLQVSMPGQIDCALDQRVVDFEERSWGAMKSMYR